MFNKLNQFKEMKKIYTALSQEVVQAKGAKGRINITMNGAFQITNVSVDPELLVPEQKKVVEDGIKEAMTEAIKQIFQKLSEKKDTFAGLAGGLPK